MNAEYRALSRFSLGAASLLGRLLVFVDFEIRQNTLAVEGAAIEALAAPSIEFVTAWSTKT